MNAALGARRSGFVLLEIVLALFLLVGAAAALLGGLNSAAQSVSQLERQAIAADLAWTALSGLKMALVPPVPFGPESVGEDYPGWDWQILFRSPERRRREDRGDTQVMSGELRDVEVVVRYREEGAREPELTYRIQQQVLVGGRGFGAVFETLAASPEIDVASAGDALPTADATADSEQDENDDEGRLGADTEGATSPSARRSRGGVVDQRGVGNAGDRGGTQRDDPNVPRERGDFFDSTFRGGPEGAFGESETGYREGRDGADRRGENR